MPHQTICPGFHPPVFLPVLRQLLAGHAIARQMHYSAHRMQRLPVMVLQVVALPVWLEVPQQQAVWVPLVQDAQQVSKQAWEPGVQMPPTLMVGYWAQTLR